MQQIYQNNKIRLYETLIKPVLSYESGGGGRQHRGCIIPQTVTHSLVLLKIGKIISWNMLSWLELLISR